MIAQRMWCRRHNVSLLAHHHGDVTFVLIHPGWGQRHTWHTTDESTHWLLGTFNIHHYLLAFRCRVLVNQYSSPSKRCTAAALPVVVFTDDTHNLHSMLLYLRLPMEAKAAARSYHGSYSWRGVSSLSIIIITTILIVLP